MTIYQGSVLIFNGPDRTHINKVAEAMGRGPYNLSRKLTTEDPAVWTSTVSGWYGYHAGGAAIFDMWHSLVGAVPTVDDEGNPIDWSAWGITEAEAQAAVNAFYVFAYSGTTPQHDYISTCAASLTPAQYKVPDEPL